MSKKDLVPMFPHLIKKEQQTVETLLRAFDERVEPLTDGIRERLEQYFRYIQNARAEQGDWFEWSLRGISQVATKVTVEQRAIAYLLGIYKTWLNCGFGTYQSEQMKHVRELFKSKFGIEPTSAAVQKLNSMIHEFGMVHAVSSVCMTKAPTQQYISLMIAEACICHARQNFQPVDNKNERGERQGA